MALHKFDFSYKRAYQDEIVYNTLVTKFENGKEQRRAKGSPRRKFYLEFDKANTTSSDAQAIWDFFVARKGKYEAFLWDYTKADGSTEEVKVRFNHDNLKRDVFMDLLYEHGLEFIEVI